MATSELIELLKPYATRGVADWGETDAATRLQLAKPLGTNRIVDNMHGISRVIKALEQRKVVEQFIPMPYVRHERKIARCFFLPSSENYGDDRVCYDLLLVINPSEDQPACLGFRFEPADPPEQSHSYGHIQINQKMCRESLAVSGIPLWVPDSYPAFPLRTSDPVLMFLAMATSVHGYAAGGMLDLLKGMFPQSPLPLKKYVESLAKLRE